MNRFVQYLSIYIPDTLDTMFHATGCSIRCLCKVPFKKLIFMSRTLIFLSNSSFYAIAGCIFCEGGLVSYFDRMMLNLFDQLGVYCGRYLDNAADSLFRSGLFHGVSLCTSYVHCAHVNIFGLLR